MEKKKTLKIKKTYLIIFALAIAFAIMGFIDLKVNAAELTVPAINEQYLNYTYISDYVAGSFTSSREDVGTLQTNPPIRIGLYVGYDSYGNPYYNLYYNTLLNQEVYVSIKRTETVNGETTTQNRSDLALISLIPNCVIETSEERYTYQLSLDTNIPIFKDYESCKNYVNTGVINEEDLYELPVDYSQLQIDDSMPIPTNFVLSKISNNIVVGLKDYDEMYDYIKWSNTSDLPIQVQVCPIVQVYKNKNLGFSYGDFVRNYDSNYLVDEILEQPTISYIFEVRNDYFVSDIDPYPHTDFLNYYKDIYDKEDTGTFGKYVLNYTCGYRFRYVDIDNMKAGPWIHVWPDRIVGKTVTYITYSDGTFTNDIDSTGTQNKYDGAELDEMIENTETENFYKDKYDDFDTEINVDEAKTWLDTVSEFIKGTPQFIGATLSFLPKPILYGMYVCIFMSVVAVAVAIFKALI